MENILTIYNANFYINNNHIINNLSLSLAKGEMTTIAGVSGSGKTTLAKLILGIYKGENEIVFNDEQLNYHSLSKIRKQIGICFSEPIFKYKKVDTELSYPLFILGYNKKKIKELVFNMKKIFKIEKTKIEDLTKSEKYKLIIARALIFEPKLLILDDIFVNFDEKEKLRIFKIIKEIKEFNGMSVLILTTDLNDVFYGNRVLILDKGILIFDGNISNVFGDIDILEKCGFELPFMLDLSNKLRFYDLVDKLFLNKRELVNHLW